MQNRFQFILLKAYWEGAVSRQDLMNQFAIASTQATKDFKAFRENFPNAVHYDGTLRRYIPSQGIHLYLNDQSFEGYQQSVSSQAVTQTIIPSRPQIKAVLYRPFYQAIQQQTGLKLKLSNPQKVERTLIFFPHQFIQSTFGWHCRGWDAEAQKFCTLSLAEIEACHGISQTCSQNQKDDQDWQNHIDLLLIANPNLSSARRKQIELERGLEKGVLHLKCRIALLTFVLEYHQVMDIGNEVSSRQALVLGNHKDLIHYLERLT